MYLTTTNIQNKVVLVVLTFLLLPSLMGNSLASTSGTLKEVVGNEKMQIYVISVKEKDTNEPNKRVDVEVVLKNIEPNPRIFNAFFAKVIDSNGNERKAFPLLSTVMPVRIPSDDILRGILTFSVPSSADVIMLVWEEFDGSKLVVDLTKTKNPPDPLPESGWVLSSNKGIILSDDRTRLTVHNELLNKSPTSTFYLVDISIKNLSKETVPYTPTFSFVKDQDGNLYPADIQNFRLINNPLKKGELKQGEEVRGEILFLLPDTVNNVMFIYDESLGTGSYFAVPEFTYYIMVFSILIGTSLLLTVRYKRLSSRYLCCDLDSKSL